MPDLLPMIQSHVGDRCGIYDEEGTIGQRIRGGEIGGRVCLICSNVKITVCIQDARYVVHVTGIVVSHVGVDRQIPGVPRLHGVSFVLCY